MLKEIPYITWFQLNRLFEEVENIYYTFTVRQKKKLRQDHNIDCAYAFAKYIFDCADIEY